MKTRALGAFLAVFVCAASSSVLVARAAPAAGPAAPAAAPAVPRPAAAASEYGNPKFTAPLEEGLKQFYSRDFKAAQAGFQEALAVAPGNTFAISFLNAAAAQRTGELDVLTNVEEDAVSGAPKNYINHVRLGFSYMFQSVAGRDRSQDARDELQTAINLDPNAAAAHVGLGIMRFNERSANRAKLELLAALQADPNNVLAREYLGQLYQTDLRDAQRGLSYVIDVPNLVPGYPDIQFHIGSLLFDLKQSDAALGYLRRGIELDPGHVGEAGLHGYTLVARILIDQHKLPEAQKVLDQALLADVDTIYAHTLLAKIKNGDYGASPGPSVPTKKP
jgi:tetratricopeptide (TPR) repeat protein